MQETQTAAATAMEVTSGPDQNGEITLGIGLSPAALKLKIGQDKEMREILKEYVKSELKLGYHYDDKIGTQSTGRKFLLQEGARNIVSLFNLFFGEPRLVEERLEDEHYRVRAHVGVFNRRGEQIASGDGLCTTRETKYAYRKAERVCPDCEQPTVKKSNRGQQGWYCWDKLGGCGANFKADDARIVDQQLGRVDNPDLADVENTVLKMAIKRAKVAAVCDLPVVSYIFAPEGDTTTTTNQNQTTRPTPAKGNGQHRVNADVPNATSPAPPSQETAVQVVENLVAKLITRGVALDDLKAQFLPAGVDAFERLTEAQAEEIKPAVVELLNAKLKK